MNCQETERRGMGKPDLLSAVDGTRPESNRGARICSPLRNHSATRLFEVYLGRENCLTFESPSKDNCHTLRINDLATCISLVCPPGSARACYNRRKVWKCEARLTFS